MDDITIELLNGRCALIVNNEKRITELLKQLSKNAPEDITTDDIERMLAQDDYYMFAAIINNGRSSNGLIVGIGIIFFREILMGYTGYIEDVVVDNKYRGIGVGLILGKRMIEIASSKRVRVIHLRSGNQRKAAHRLWLSLGFKPADSTSFDLYDLKL